MKPVFKSHESWSAGTGYVGSLKQSNRKVLNFLKIGRRTDRQRGCVARGSRCAQDAIQSSVRLAPTKRCVPEFPAIRARSGARLPYLCDPAAFGASEQTGSCTRPPLAPGARRRPEGQPYECFWGSAQAAGSVLAAKMGMLWRSSWLKSRQLLLPPVSLPAVLPPYGFNKCPWAL